MSGEEAWFRSEIAASTERLKETLAGGGVSDKHAGWGESYPDGWLHAVVHYHPETGEIHAEGDLEVRFAWLAARAALEVESEARQEAEARAARYRDAMASVGLGAMADRIDTNWGRR